MCHRSEILSGGIAATLSLVAGVETVVRSSSVGATVRAVTTRRFDLVVVAASAASSWREACRRISDEMIPAHEQGATVLVGLGSSHRHFTRGDTLNAAGYVDLGGSELDVARKIVDIGRRNLGLGPEDALRARERHGVDCRDEVDDQIMDGIAEGLSDVEIAGAIHYAVQSVRNRVSRILQDSGVRNRTELAVMFIREGIRWRPDSFDAER